MYPSVLGFGIRLTSLPVLSSHLMTFLSFLLNQLVSKSSSLILWLTGRSQDPDSISSHTKTSNKTKTRLKLISGSHYLPKKGNGQDAHFIEERVFGVADGVGGWVRKGIDSGKYACELMSNSVIAIQRERKGYVDPEKILWEAYLNTKAEGSSTACIVALRDQCLHAVNVGDSGFIVIRKGIVVYCSPVQQYYFNYTYQLGNSDGCDRPSSAVVLEFPVEQGDIIVAGTDGLFDNLFEQMIAEDVINGTRLMGMCPQWVASMIAKHAQNTSYRKRIETPFSIAARRNGYRKFGGKVDDITVVVAYVVPSNFMMNP